MGIKRIQIEYEVLKGVNYIGRVVGLINDEQFARLHMDAATLARKIATVESISLTQVYNSGVEGKRLIMVVRSPKGIAELLVSNKLKTIISTSSTGSIYSFLRIQDVDLKVLSLKNSSNV